ncbi:MAG: PAS domain S-box protein [Planctomycetaceae bacterium]|nr:PAS domain S-box protein [Planctomycetaceae bacterium]
MEPASGSIARMQGDLLMDLFRSRLPEEDWLVRLTQLNNQSELLAAVRPAIILLSAAAVLMTFGSLLALRVWNSSQRSDLRILLWLASILTFSGALLVIYAVTDASLWPSAGGMIEPIVGVLMPCLGVLSIVLLERFLRLHWHSLQETQQTLNDIRSQLTNEQSLFANLVDSLPDAVYFKDRESRFIRANRQVATIFQVPSVKDVVGKSDSDFLRADESETYRRDELRILETGEPLINKEECEVWADGVTRWVLTTKLPLRNADGLIVGTFGLSRDITRQKNAERELAAKVVELQRLSVELQQQQDLLTTLVENIPDAVFFKDRQGRFIRVNPAMARDAGFASPSGMIGLTDFDIWDIGIAEQARADEEEIMQTGRPVIGKQERICNAEGNDERWVVTTKMPLRDQAGRITGTFGLAHDITTLKVTEAWLSESQDRFERAVQGAADGLWDWDIETGEVWYAPRFRELLGYGTQDSEQFPSLRSSFVNHLHPDDRPSVLKSFDDHLLRGVPHVIEYRLRMADGRYRWFCGRGLAIRNRDGVAVRMAGSIQDITERRNAETELQRTKLQLQQALEGGNVGMWEWDIVTNDVVVSPETLAQLGEGPGDEWTSLDDWEKRLHPDDAADAVKRTTDYIQGRSEKYESSFRLRHKDGSWRWILSRGKVFRDASGNPRRFIGCHVDVTNQRRVEQALAESEARFRGIFNQTFQFIGLLSPDGIVLDANRAALNAAGLEAEDVIGKKFWETVYWTHDPDLQARLKLAVQRAAAGKFDRFEAHHLAPDGSVIQVDFSLKPALDDHGNVVYLIPEGRDVTMLKMAEADLTARTEELQRSNQELEQFAYVASHDLQEPLRAIIGYCQLLELDYTERLDEEGRDIVTRIVAGGKRMHQLISDLLEYSRVHRKGRPLEPTELNLVTEEATTLLSGTIREAGAKLQIENLPTVMGDRVQLMQLMQNLIGNALKYRADRVPEIRISAEDDDTHWRIRVQDNGIGIDPEYFEQVFVIFKRLHTREEYPGTGIGLAVCKRIVERHGGRIWVESSPGQGATFVFTLQKVDGNVGNEEGG